MFPFLVTFAVRTDNPAATVADLKGQRVPSGIRAAATGALIFGSILEAAGLSYDDVTPVEASDYTAAREDFLERRTDATVFIIGNGSYARLASQAGGVKALGIPPTENLDARLKAMHPAFRAELVPGDSGNVGVEDDIWVLAYDYVLYTSADLPDDTASKMAEVLVDGATAMSESVQGFKSFDVDKVAADVGLPLHPGARNFYAERGLLPSQ
jgi:TRAP transporter TAXI family solute receptor